MVRNHLFRGRAKKIVTHSPLGNSFFSVGSHHREQSWAARCCCCSGKVAGQQRCEQQASAIAAPLIKHHKVPGVLWRLDLLVGWHLAFSG